jgi:hypothetical protein
LTPAAGSAGRSRAAPPYSYSHPARWETNPQSWRCVLQMSADLAFEDHGSLVLAQPLSERGRSWLAEHCPAGDDHTYYGDALVVEHRYAADLAQTAHADGLQVS